MFFEESDASVEDLKVGGVEFFLAPEKKWLEDDCFLFGMSSWQVLC